MARVIRRTVEDREVVADDDVVVRPAHPFDMIERLIWFITGLILLLLAFRFLLSLLGANPANAFADFIYDASNPLVAPFFGLFNYNVVDYGISRFEIFTLVAMLVYAAIAWILTYLFAIGRE